MSKRIVIALGGNALGTTLEEQFNAVQVTSKAIVDLIEEGNDVVIVHGNGPQVGIINNAMVSLTHEDPTQGFTPLSVCGAMSEAYIGYDLQNAIREELLNRGMSKPVATVVTQTVVDQTDPAFQNPTKPIGKFVTAEDAKEIAAKTGYLMKEDAGRGWRRYVASPKPISIVEWPAIKILSENGAVVIACGGGGIPVTAEGNHLHGAAAVIDKDFAAELLAELLEADMLIILTAVEKVSINYKKPNQADLSELTPADAAKYIAEGQFAPGSMLPKVEAAVKFAQSRSDRTALITLLSKAKDGIAGKTGTHVHQ
ncbi:MAG: carbamate kinase [Clostridiales bacterium]|nr:carbamate kinase [Candidatus Cacconaster stercorequi]